MIKVYRNHKLYKEYKNLDIRNAYDYEGVVKECLLEVGYSIEDIEDLEENKYSPTHCPLLQRFRISDFNIQSY